MIHGVGLGDQEAENRANDLPSFLRALGGGTGPHTFSKVTQTLVRLGKETAAPPSHAQAPAHLSAPQGEETAPATPRSFPALHQQGPGRTLQPTDPPGVASIAPHVHVTREALPQRPSTQRGCEVKDRTIHPFCPFPHALHNTAEGSVKLDLGLNDVIASYTHLHPVTPTQELQTPGSLPSYYHPHAMGTLTLRACPPL